MARSRGESGEIRGVLEQLERAGENAMLDLEGRQLRVTHLEKPLWPAQGGQPPVTKRELLRYLTTVSPHLLGYLRDRPITIVRFPTGVTGKRFIQRHAERVPDFVATVAIYTEDVEADRDYLLCNNLTTLLWLGQMSALEIHGWYSRVTADRGGRASGPPTGSEAAVEAAAVNYPDFLVFDLDPYVYSGQEARGAEPELHPAGFAQTAEVALRLKELLDDRGLVGYPKTSGRTGLHVFVPTRRTVRYEQTHAIAEEMAQEIVDRYPKLATVQWAVRKRRGMILIDVNQNVRGKTLPPPYSPRRHPDATVSMPVRWEELGSIYPSDFTIRTAPARVAQLGDLWADILAADQDLNSQTLRQRGSSPARRERSA